MADRTTLYGKLAEVIGEVGYVAKDGKNDFQNYRYTSAEALLAAIRGPLSARGVVLMPSLIDIGEREYTTSKGKASIITTARVRFTLVDGETGERHECEWAGQGDDPADKGLGKAYTNAIKTFLREQFLIPTGEDPEADATADKRAADRVASTGGGHARRSPAPAPVLDDASVREVVAAIGRAKMGTEWVRGQLSAAGAQKVPTGPITEGTIRALTPEQAVSIVKACDTAADAEATPA